MSGEEPVNRHVFITTRYRRLLLRRWRWSCSCGATQGGYFWKASAVFHGDNHSMRAA